LDLERSGLIKFKGNDAIIIGGDLKPGDIAQDFLCHSNDWLLFHGLQDTKGKVRIIASVPSLDTDVCDRESRRFNSEAVNLDMDIVVLVISMDLPYAQKRWCGSASIERIITLSDHISGDFGRKYGCLMKDFGLLRRAVFIVDRDDRIVYSAYMTNLGDEPDYDTVLEFAKSGLKGEGVK
jgi:thiol peroxidase